MDRDEFMDLVYETFADEPDNVLANGIIEAADAYVEHEKAQLSQEDATFDLISRRETIDRFNVIRPVDPKKDEYTKGIDVGIAMCIVAVKDQPTMQPELKMVKWTLGFDNIYMEKYYYCSRCGCRKYGRHEPIDYFCSNSGAKMTISK